MPRSTHSVKDQALTPASERGALVGPLFWEALASGRLTQDMPAWRAYTGQPEPLPSAGWLNGVVHPEDRPATTSAWASALRGGQAFSISHRLRAADGTYRPFLTQARPVFDDAGTVVRFQGVTCDLTEVQRDANRLRGQAAAFGVIRDSVILTDQDLRVLDWNPAAEALFGYTHAEALGQVITLLHPASDERHSPPAIMAHLRHRGPWEGELPFARKDDTRGTCAVLARPLEDARGEPVGAIWIHRDATTRSAGEAELERSAAARAAELEAVLDTMTDAVYVYDPAGHVVRTNAAARALNPHVTETSYQDAMFNARIQRFIVRDAAGEPLAPEQTPVARTLRGERVTAAESVMRRDDGHDIRLSTGGAPIRDAAGQISGAVSVVRDVTDRYALEQRNLSALQALLDMARALVDEDASALSGPAGGSAERVAARVAELTREVLTCQWATLYKLDVPGARLRPLALAERHRRVSPTAWRERGSDIATDAGEGMALLARLTAGEVVIEERATDPSSASASAVAVSVPLRVAGELIGMLRVVYSAPDRARLMEELRLAEAVAQLAALVIERQRLLAEWGEARANELALREANRRMDEFLGIASHELKTPLTSIKSSIQVLGRRVTRGETPTHEEVVRLTLRSLDGMTRGVTRMERLINDLLDVSRIREGRLDFQKEPCDLLAIVRAGVEDARQLQPERTIRLTVRDGTTEVPLLADADRIGQVLTNFLLNALKYSPLERPIEVTVRDAGDRVRVVVRDEGPGLAPDQQQRVWDLFHRVPGIEVLHGSGIGLGLGLHISRNIVERHGGAVGVESAAGHGASFWFELPRSLPAAE